MVKKKTFEGWNVLAIGIITKENDNNEVLSIFAKYLRNFT